MKKAMELPTNFVILMILGLLMFGSAMYIAYKVFWSADDLQKKLTDQTEKQVRDTLMRGNGKVMLSTVALEVKRGNNDLIGIGIRNHGTAAETYYIQGSCTMVILPDDTVFCDNSGIKPCTGFCDSWITTGAQQFGGSIKLDSKESRVMPVYFRVPPKADNGEYWFQLNVCTGNYCTLPGGVKYDSAKMLSVRVA